jgi:hypothetical protein
MVRGQKQSSFFSHFAVPWFERQEFQIDAIRSNRHSVDIRNRFARIYVNMAQTNGDWKGLRPKPIARWPQFHEHLKVGYFQLESNPSSLGTAKMDSLPDGENHQAECDNCKQSIENKLPTICHAIVPTLFILALVSCPLAIWLGIWGGEFADAGHPTMGFLVQAVVVLFAAICLFSYALSPLLLSWFCVCLPPRSFDITRREIL